jgi:hypothetical protein
MKGRKKPPLFAIGSSVWLCDHCGAHAPVEWTPEESLYSAVEKIRAAHAKQSPNCKGRNDYRIHIVNLEKMKAKGRIA